MLDTRPSGTRQRLADALGKHRSFITQMTSPTYPTPIPQRHLATMFAVCHFSPAEREAFLAAYRAAHRGKLETRRCRSARCATCRCWCPTSATTSPTPRFDKAIAEFVAEDERRSCASGGDE